MSDKDGGRLPDRGPASRLRFEKDAPPKDTPATSGRNVQKSRQGQRPTEGTGPEPVRDAPASALRFEHEDAAPQDTPASDTPATSGRNVQKSRRGRRPAETGAGPEPVRDAPASALRFECEDTAPATDTPATSGRNVQKSGAGKLKQDKEQARPSDRLRLDKDDPPRGGASAGGGTAGGDSGPRSDDGPRPGGKKAAREERRFDKSKRRMDKSEGKLGKARDKLAAQKPRKKPGPIKKAGGLVKHEAWAYTHGKIYQVEHENVGVEAGHKTELAGETVIRGTTRFVKKRIRTRPARQVRKWEKKSIKFRADHDFRKLAQEHPELNKNALSRFWHKRRLKKQYQKQAREAAKQGAKATKKAASLTVRLFRAVGRFIASNPKVILIAAIFFLLIIILQSCMGMLATVGSGIAGAAGGTSYLAEDGDIDAAELAYTEWETDLYLEAMNAESSHPGFDEYRYNVADISHNPYELMAYLTATFDDFTFAQAEAHLRELFNEQYTLSFVEEVEVRYRTETRTDENGDSYTVEVPYNYYILNVNLTARSFTEVIYPRMDGEALERYNIYMVTKGNRQYLQSPFGDTNWLPYVSSYYGYRVHPISGAKDLHRGVDIAMPQGTEILAGQSGTVTFAGNNGDYGLVVVLDDGEGLVSKYAHCSALLVSAGQTVEAGDPIARVGSTGNSTGPHLHLEILKDGQYLNPLYFAVTNDYTHSGMGGPGPIYGDGGAAMGDGSYAALIEEAERYLGYPYVWGGSSPSTSFDCSGYICWIFTQSGVYNLPRTTAQGIYNQCTPIPTSEAQPGDLIFFVGTYSTTGISHVGLYVGNGMMIHCGNPISYTSINTSYWQSHFYSFGRLPTN